MSKISTTTLGDLIEFQRGYDLPKSDFNFGKYPVISSNGILGYHDEYKVIGPGITIGRSGTVGLPHFINENFFPHNTSLFVKDFKGNEPKYIFYLLKTLGLQSQKSGSGVPTMNRNHLHPLKVLAYLNIDTQKRIANVLSALDAKIELNNRINAELESLAKTIYDYWFVQFDFPFDFAQGKPSADGKPYKSSGGEMVYVEGSDRAIPTGWEVKKLSDIADITMGQSPDGSSYNEEKKGEIFFQGSTDFGWRFPTVRQYTTAPSRLAKKGDILLSVRAPVGTLNIADNDCCIGRGLASIRSKYGFDSYLFYVMQYFKTIFDHRNNSGTTFGSINKDDLHTLKLVYPSEDCLKKYDEIVSKYNSLILNNHKQNQQLTQLRDWLLPMLMNGQVSIK